jgi:hypothetical protein
VIFCEKKVKSSCRFDFAAGSSSDLTLQRYGWSQRGATSILMDSDTILIAALGFDSEKPGL